MSASQCEIKGVDTVAEVSSSGELIIEVHRQGRPFGVLAIHSLFSGSARGGIRIAPDVSAGELRELAEDMTLKFGFLGLPQGGAKAGIRADADAPEEVRFDHLKAFGRALLPLLRTKIYLPGADMGTTTPMIRRMLVELGVRVPARELRGTRSGYFTAMTAMASVRHAAPFAGVTLEGGAAAVEGFGKVGAPLAQMLVAAGVKVVAVSTSFGAIYDARGIDVEDASRAARAEGSRFVLNYAKAERLPREQLFEVPADILCPCARPDAISPATAAAIHARLVVPGANHPYEVETERLLHARGVLCVPDFVSNCGGVLGETLAFAGWRDPEIEEYTYRRLGAAIDALLRESRARGIAPSDIATPLCLKRFAEDAAAAERGGLAAAARGVVLRLYQEGLVPAAPVRIFSRRYFETQVLRPFEF
jgi:glutamate dehydrogenase (NAD(P)+)